MPFGTPAFKDAKRACYAGLDSVTLRREIVNRVAATIDFDAYAFSTCDPDTGIMTHTLADGVPAPLASLYAEFLYPTTLALLATNMARNRRNVFSMADQSPVARDALVRHGMREQLYVSASAFGRLWGTWCLMSDQSSSTMKSRHYAFLNRLAPHIARGLRSAAQIDSAITSDARLDNEAGVLVLDARNRPRLQTHIVARWLKDLRDDGLWMADDIPLSIIALAGDVRRKADSVGFERQLRARGRSGRLYILRASLAEPDASEESSIVVVISPALPHETATVLTELYALSPREREVIAAVARGEATKAIAAALQISQHTVTEHIHRACDKIGVRGRRALIAKLYFDGYAPKLRAPRITMGDLEGASANQTTSPNV